LDAFGEDPPLSLGQASLTGFPMHMAYVISIVLIETRNQKPQPMWRCGELEKYRQLLKCFCWQYIAF
jgi:hypothetical protein